MDDPAGALSLQRKRLYALVLRSDLAAQVNSCNDEGMGELARHSGAGDEDALDAAEVPATVVCARCGDPDCPGCSAVEDNTLPSGVIAIIPWERPIGSGWARLWATANATTRRAESFFGPMPKGDYAAPLRFSVICELTAVSSVTISLIVIALAIAPSLTAGVLSDSHARGLIARLALLGVPAFAALLVTVHLIHGWAIDVGACRQGARSHRSQALRFGMYSAGLDLLTSPIGFAYTLLSQGPRAAFSLFPAAVDVPAISSTALLRRVYHLADSSAIRARRFSTIVVSIAAVVLIVTVLAFLLVALLV